MSSTVPEFVPGLAAKTRGLRTGAFLTATPALQSSSGPNGTDRERGPDFQRIEGPAESVKRL